MSITSNEPQVLYPTLQKHTYPRWVKFFVGMLLGLLLFTNYDFLSNELAYHRLACGEIQTAKNVFDNKNYHASIKLYQDLLKKYPSYKTAKLNIAKSYFALSKNNFEFYVAGLLYLDEPSYRKYEIHDVQSYVPENWVHNFKGLFTEEKKSWFL